MSSFGFKATANTTTMDQRLSNLSLMYRNPDANYIYNQVLTPLTVQQTEGRILRYNQENIKNFNMEVAFGQQGNFVQSSIGNDLTYKLKQYKADDVVTDMEILNSAPGGISPLDAKTMILTDQMNVQQEILAAALFSAQSADVTLTGSTKWSDYSSSDPRKNILDGIKTMAAKGKIPNVAIMSYSVFLTLAEHPDVKRDLPSNALAVAQEQAIATLLRVDKVLVAKNIYDTTNLGIAASKDYIWGNDFYLARIAPATQYMMNTFGFYVSLGGMGRKIQNVYEPLRGAKILQIEDTFQFLACDTENIYRIATVI